MDRTTEKFDQWGNKICKEDRQNQQQEDAAKHVNQQDREAESVISYERNDDDAQQNARLQPVSFSSNLCGYARDVFSFLVFHFRGWLIIESANYSAHRLLVGRRDAAKFNSESIRSSVVDDLAVQRQGVILVQQ